MLIGQTAIREALSADPLFENPPPVWEPVPDWGAVTRRLPSLTLDRELTLHPGGRRVDLRHPGCPAHTPGDVVAWLPGERVLFTGDLLFQWLTPLVLMGSLDGALRSLEWVRSFAPDHVVPGHGPVLAGTGLDAVPWPPTSATTGSCSRSPGDAVREDRTPLECARSTGLGEFAGWADAERIVMNLHRAMADLSGEPLEVARSLTDTVERNGGPMPTTL